MAVHVQSDIFIYVTKSESEIHILACHTEISNYLSETRDFCKWFSSELYCRFKKDNSKLSHMHILLCLDKGPS